MVWKKGSYNKKEMIFNKGLKIFQKRVGLTRKGWRKKQWF